MDSTSEVLVPLPEAAKMLGVGRETMARMIREGVVPGAVKSGRRYIIVRCRFERWLRGEDDITPNTRPLIVRRDWVSPN